MRLAPSILGTIVLAGCAMHPAPAPEPAPLPAQATAPAPGAPVFVVTSSHVDTVASGAVNQAGRPSGPSVGTSASPASTSAPSSASSSAAPSASTSAPSSAAASSPASSVDASVDVSDVKRRAAEVFGDSLSAAPAVADSASADAEPTWDMDVRSYETQDRVAHYVSMFSGRAKERIAARLDVGSRYEPMIRAKMKAGGLPEDMYYLALIESGFDNHAYSRAAAVGMWQFMTSTARGMGMRVDWWVDERRDPVKATIAAVRFIRGMRDQFGSLYLAAAAYNGGPGRVARGLARYADDIDDAEQREDAFFVLAEKDYLKNETREYVPQLIAAALVAKEASKYGMELHPQPAFAYDSVKVPASTPLAAIAHAAGASVADIKELNPHLLRGMTPPKITWLTRIPPGTAARFDSAFARLPKDELVATHTVETKKGDTAARLADRFGVSESAIEGFNPNLRRLKSGRLAPGQVVAIPTHAVAAAALHVPNPSIEKYPGSTKRVKLHTVKHGETLGLIARRYGTTTAKVMKLNGLRKPMIFPGQTLIVSGKAAKGGKGARSSKSSTGAKAGKGSAKAGKHAGKSTKSSAKSSKASPKAKKHSGATQKRGARATKVVRKAA